MFANLIVIIISFLIIQEELVLIQCLPIFPGAVGFGTTTPGGSGRHLSPALTTVYKITTLDKSGPGTLEECMNANGPRTCIFEISGTILYEDYMDINDPYITIAGETAPSPVSWEY